MLKTHSVLWGNTLTLLEPIMTSHSAATWADHTINAPNAAFSLPGRTSVAYTTVPAHLA